MKISKVKSRKYKEKTYYKYRINIPEESLNKAGFKEGDELISEIRKGMILLRKNERNI
ncbi:MAG: hypothetical protein AABX95_01925 [Nanoarchaeota archaeon]